jgi:hypothetical protein
MSAQGRVALLTLVLLCAAGAGVVRLSIRPHTDETCADWRALSEPEGIGLPTDGVRVDGGPRSRTMDGLVLSPDGGSPALFFTIRRTFQLPNWLMRPTTAIPGPREPDRLETRTLDVDGTPVHVRFAYAMHRSHERFAVYTLAYDGRSILSAFWLRVLEAPRAIVRGARPITYIGVANSAGLMDLANQERRAIEFIEAAWRHYRRSCAS